VQLPGFIEYLLLVDSHSHVLTKMLSPGKYHVVQTEQAGMIQAFVNPTGRRRSDDMQLELLPSKVETALDLR
jgi:hypothetical protein